MTQSITAKRYFIPTLMFATVACSTNQAESAPAVALSETREGISAEPRAVGTSPRKSGDTLICEKPGKFSTADGDRWLWLRVLVERKPGSDTDKTIAEAVVTSDPKGTEYGPKVDLAGVALDGDKEYTLRGTTGVRTAAAKESAKQAHRARGYTVGPNLGPFEVSCGG
jgi:hypothetical protein